MPDTNRARPSHRAQIWSILWQGSPDEEAAARRLTTTLSVKPLTARLLCIRGLTDPDRAAEFLSHGGMELHDPFLMADMAPAVARVLAAVRRRETVAVYGDYDVDGVTSLSCLYLYLRELGLEVCRYIPDRLREGYGMSHAGVDALAAQGVSLIITVDTGVTAIQEVAYAATLGIETVVTDHHECLEELPDCVAVVDSHRPDCPYPFKELAGVGVAFKLICACEQARTGRSAEEVYADIGPRFLDLVAIGTVADVVPLRDENRLIVAGGLELLDHADIRPGIAALLEAASGKGVRSAASDGRRPHRRVTATVIGYTIAPRLNAAGRISNAMEAVELLLSEDMADAEARAEALCRINVKRQEEENRIATEAFRRIDAAAEAYSTEEAEAVPQVLVLADDSWAQGVIGIVSSRITDAYGLPSILISFEGVPTDGGQEIGKGSGRSVRGLDLFDALSSCQDLLVRFGGHELAAGLCVRRQDIPALQARLNAYAAAHLTPDMTVLRREADCSVRAEELTMDQARELDLLEPFGAANPAPVLLLEDATIQHITPLSGGKHTRLCLYAEGRLLTALWFGQTTAALPVQAGDRVDVLFQLNINEYQGVESLQLILQDLRRSETERRTRIVGRARLEEILSGAPFSPEEGLLPDREDVARVYVYLRERARADCRSMSLSELETGLAARGSVMSYVKLHLILRILREMAVCRIEETENDLFTFEINTNAPRTTVDASPLMCKLRARCIGQPTE